MSTPHVKLRSDALEWRRLEGEIVALDLRSSEYFAVNRTGAVIWDLLLDGSTENELAATVVERFSVPAERAAEDVGEFVKQLAARDLLESR
jgi:hypothetical protein